MSTTYMTIVALVAIVIVAVVILTFFGSNAGTGPQQSSAEVTPTVAVTTTVTMHSPKVQETLDPASIRVPTTVAIANTGIFIRINYLGAYTGSYHADGEMHDINTSGDRLFKVENSSQTVTATAKKADRSAKQALTIEVWKNGNLLESASTADLFGEVSVSAQV